MRRFALLFCFLAIAAALPPGPPMPTGRKVSSPKHQEHVRSMGKPMRVIAMRPLIVAPSVFLYTFANETFNSQGLIAQVQRATNLSGPWTAYSQIAYTNSFNLFVTNDRPQAFFRVHP